MCLSLRLWRFCLARWTIFSTDFSLLFPFTALSSLFLSSHSLCPFPSFPHFPPFSFHPFRSSFPSFPPSTLSALPSLFFSPCCTLDLLTSFLPSLFSPSLLSLQMNYFWTSIWTWRSYVQHYSGSDFVHGVLYIRSGSILLLVLIDCFAPVWTINLHAASSPSHFWQPCVEINIQNCSVCTY